MASVTSLGLHQPTALPYLVQECLLPPDAPANTYTWQNIPSHDDSASGDDELLVTKTCVVWSRGGLVRKSFRFEVEEEPVTQAVLTYFPSERNKKHLAAQENKEHPKSDSFEPLSDSKHSEKSRSKALVVFLKTQAHVYFLSGTSHVIHLPFEVEYVSPAPCGL